MTCPCLCHYNCAVLCCSFLRSFRSRAGRLGPDPGTRPSKPWPTLSSASPPGHSQWTVRTSLAILQGCIPVTFSREHHSAFQVQHSIVLCLHTICTVLYCTLPVDSTALYSTLLDCTVLCSTLLYCTLPVDSAHLPRHSPELHPCHFLSFFSHRTRWITLPSLSTYLSWHYELSRCLTVKCRIHYCDMFSLDYRTRWITLPSHLTWTLTTFRCSREESTGYDGTRTGSAACRQPSEQHRCLLFFILDPILLLLLLILMPQIALSWDPVVLQRRNAWCPLRGVCNASRHCTSHVLVLLLLLK